jgi:signal transduction histidine kinase/DNA-binding response OmpR family regulator
MADRLIETQREEMERRIDQASRELRETLAGLEKRNAELVQAKRDALAASREKSEFLAKTSHEIRAELNGILGYVNLLLKTGLDEVQRAQAGVIRRSSDALLNIINDFLDYSKMEAGKLEISTVGFDLVECVKGAVDLLTPEAREKGLDLAFHVHPQVPRHVRTDPARVRQVLVNLLSNAVKYTAAGGVMVHVKRGGALRDTLQFSVADTGVGISREAQDRLFEPFCQGDCMASHAAQGTGLGLVICKELVELMQGNISLESVPGEGTRVCFTIRYEQEGREATSVILPEFRETAPESQEDGRFTDLSILVADDNEVNRRLLSALLGAKGARVSVAEDGVQAWETLAERHFDLVLMDVNMPGLDGVTVTAMLRAFERQQRHAPVVALTADAGVGTKEKLLAAGMDDYLSKPFSEEALDRLVEHWCFGAEPFLEEGSDHAGSDGGSGPLLVRDRSEAVKIAGGNTALADELFETLLARMCHDSQEIRRNLADGNVNRIAHLAHTLAGGAAACAARRLRAAAYALERAARGRDGKHVRDRLDELDQEIELLACEAHAR